MSYGHFSIEEREIIAVRLAEDGNPTQIAKELGRHHSSVLAEIRRNSIDGEYCTIRPGHKRWRISDAEEAKALGG